MGSASAPGPGTWPAARQRRRSSCSGLVLAARARHTDDAERFTRAGLLVLAAVASMVVFVAVVGTIGFEIPTAVLAFVWLRFLGRERWRTSIVVSLGRHRRVLPAVRRRARRHHPAPVLTARRPLTCPRCSTASPSSSSRRTCCTASSASSSACSSACCPASGRPPPSRSCCRSPSTWNRSPRSSCWPASSTAPSTAAPSPRSCCACPARRRRSSPSSTATPSPGRAGPAPRWASPPSARSSAAPCRSSR